MGLRVIFSIQAKSDLEIIFDYYKNNASLKVAQSIIKNIINIAKNLKFYPNIGQIDTTLDFSDFKLQFIIYKNYKIIYSVTEKGILIHTIFDTRQNPENIVNKFKIT